MDLGDTWTSSDDQYDDEPLLPSTRKPDEEPQQWEPELAIVCVDTSKDWHLTRQQTLFSDVYLFGDFYSERYESVP